MDKKFVPFSEVMLPIESLELLGDDGMFVLKGGNIPPPPPSGSGCGCGCSSGSGCGCGCTSGSGCGCGC